MMTLVHFDEAMIHLMQFSSVISRCNITFSVFWLSQGSIATLIRWDGWSSYCHTCRSLLNLPLKSVDLWQSYTQKKISWLLFMGARRQVQGSAHAPPGFWLTQIFFAMLCNCNTLTISPTYSKNTATTLQNTLEMTSSLRQDHYKTNWALT